MRKPFALGNWKMAMTASESRVFVARFLVAAADVLEGVEVVLCPPCTALYGVGQALRGSPVGLGAQNVSAHEGEAHTGEVSARLLADAGCRWVLLGHWEVRRYLGDDDALVNRKLHRALEAGLGPVLSVGEARGWQAAAEDYLLWQLPVVLRGSAAAQVGSMVFLYEPEWMIGVAEPAPLVHVEAGCRTIRSWLRANYGDEPAEAARLIYGGSVSPEYAADLLQAPDVDGLGASRRGRDPETWAAIVRLIWHSRAAERLGRPPSPGRGTSEAQLSGAPSSTWPTCREQG